MLWFLLLAVLIGVGLMGVAVFNALVGLRNQVKNAWTQISVQLKRRYDLIPNLVETVKDYMSYEQETLQKVIQARNIASQATDMKSQASAEGALNAALKTLFAVSERYPDLKANQNAQRLMEELTGTENKISFARQFYNDSVMQYNTTIQRVPANLVAGLCGFTPEAFFEIPGAETAPVKVDLR